MSEYLHENEVFAWTFVPSDQFQISTKFPSGKVTGKVLKKQLCNFHFTIQTGTCKRIKNETERDSKGDSKRTGAVVKIDQIGGRQTNGPWDTLGRLCLVLHAFLGKELG
jgi:hypothetical protein